MFLVENAWKCVIFLGRLKHQPYCAITFPAEVFPPVLHCSHPRVPPIWWRSTRSQWELQHLGSCGKKDDFCTFLEFQDEGTKLKIYENIQFLQGARTTLCQTMAMLSIQKRQHAMGSACRRFGGDSGTEVPKIPEERNFVYNIPPLPFEISLELQRVKKNSSRMHLFGPIQFIQCSFQCCVLLVCGTCRKPLAGQKKVADTEKAKTTNIYKLGEEQRIQNLISGSLGEEPLQPLKIWWYFFRFCTSFFPLNKVKVPRFLLPKSLKCTTATWLRPAEPNFRRVTWDGGSC